MPRRGSRSGWRPGAWPSTRTRRGIVHLSEGFDFLGFNVRRYPNRKLLIKPSQAAIRRVRERLASETAHPARPVTRWRSSPRSTP